MWLGGGRGDRALERLDEGGVELEVVERREVGRSGVEGVGEGEGVAGAREGSVIGSDDFEASADHVE